MMKQKIAMSIGCLVLAGLSGCCNINAHASSYEERAGIYRGTRDFYPELVHVFIGPFCPGTCAYVPIHNAILGLPICSVMISLEIVADTVTFPYDSCVSMIETQNDEK